jgi:hypothetical protein
MASNIDKVEEKVKEEEDVKEAIKRPARLDKKWKESSILTMSVTG